MILVHFGRVSLCEILKTIISLISGFLNVALSPKTNIIYFFRPQDARTLKPIMSIMCRTNSKKTHNENA